MDFITEAYKNIKIIFTAYILQCNFLHKMHCNISLELYFRKDTVIQIEPLTIFVIHMVWNLREAREQFKGL